jgi:hypothetical protein
MEAEAPPEEAPNPQFAVDQDDDPETAAIKMEMQVLLA